MCTSHFVAEVRGHRGQLPPRILQQFGAHDGSVAIDVVGNPTPTRIFAGAVLAVLAVIARPPTPGTYHVCCVKPASKYNRATEIAEGSGYDGGRLPKSGPSIKSG